MKRLIMALAVGAFLTTAGGAMGFFPSPTPVPQAQDELRTPVQGHSTAPLPRQRPKAQTHQQAPGADSKAIAAPPQEAPKVVYVPQACPEPTQVPRAAPEVKPVAPPPADYWFFDWWRILEVLVFGGALGIISFTVRNFYRGVKTARMANIALKGIS